MSDLDVGAGGGQAGDMQTGSTEPLPVDAPGPPLCRGCGREDGGHEPGCPTTDDNSPVNVGRKGPGVDAPGPKTATEGEAGNSACKSPLSLPTGLEHKDAPLPSAVDLQRWYCGPYCPKCGFGTVPFSIGTGHPVECKSCGVLIKPGLLARCGIRVEVEWLAAGHGRRRDSSSGWFLKDGHGGGCFISPAHAADLLVMGVVREWTTWVLFEALGAAVDDVMQQDTEVGFDEAVALARHRAADSEEANE